MLSSQTPALCSQRSLSEFFYTTDESERRSPYKCQYSTTAILQRTLVIAVFSAQRKVQAFTYPPQKPSNIAIVKRLGYCSLCTLLPCSIRIVLSCIIEFNKRAGSDAWSALPDLLWSESRGRDWRKVVSLNRLHLIHSSKSYQQISRVRLSRFPAKRGKGIELCLPAGYVTAHLMSRSNPALNTAPLLEPHPWLRTKWVSIFSRKRRCNTIAVRFSRMSWIQVNSSV